MPFVTVRHLTEAEIPIRTALMRESRFQANLTDYAVVTGDDTLTERQRLGITEEYHIKRHFTLCGPREEVVGFAWITSIDWRSQCCELSFGILPRFRGAFGATAVAAAHTFVRTELNMRVVVNQVLEHNTMLVSSENLAAQRRVRCDYDSYTVGQWRTACYWSENEQDAQAQRSQVEDRRAAVAERIRAMSLRAQ
ncbi:hypothetical protein [Micromonospora sp. RTGN7]|uniref:hypothetical protein n=1 Tax=Micromonospora sp. RTGN7 TaxID=3016526 RepID=UPI0029FF086F|nr:hypothetical protein [Micromonospora sp. RTGN7]